MSEKAEEQAQPKVPRRVIEYAREVQLAKEVIQMRRPGESIKVDNGAMALPDPSLAPITTNLKRTIPLDQFDEYRFNPRKAPNPAYPGILDWVLNYPGDNVDLNLTVARRPETGRYEPAKGGNTRRLALIEAWQTTGDTRYLNVLVTEIPWPGDAAIQAWSVSENENRADLIFRDKARALVLLKAEIEKERGELSQRAFCESVQSLGYKVHQSDFSHMAWAVSVLDPVLQQAMASLSHKNVKFLRSIADTYQTYYYRYTRDRNFDAIFSASLSECDGETLDFEKLDVVLSGRIAALLGEPHWQPQVSGAVKGIMDGEPLELMAPPPEILQAEIAAHNRPSYAEKLAARAAERKARKLAKNGKPGPATQGALPDSATGNVRHNTLPAAEPFDPMRIPPAARRQEIANHQQRNAELVRKMFSSRSGPEWVDRYIDIGVELRYGFRLRPEALALAAPQVAPDQIDTAQDKLSSQRAMLWMLHYLAADSIASAQELTNHVPGSLYRFLQVVTTAKLDRWISESVLDLLDGVHALNVLYATENGGN